MRESMGSALLYNLIITFVIIMIGVLISSLAYSKAFKVKNRIINFIETNKGYDASMSNDLNSLLGEMGYKTSRVNSCEDIADFSLLTTTASGYDYCIYEKATLGDEGNKYYKVKTVMYLDMPVIGNMLQFEVWGESKIIYDTYINYEDEE